jgi:hypothetical protein
VRAIWLQGTAGLGAEHLGGQGLNSFADLQQPGIRTASNTRLSDRSPRSRWERSQGGRPRKRLVKFRTRRFRGNVLDLKASAITIWADKGASQERGGKRLTAENQQAVVQARLRTVPVREIMTAVPVTVLSPL